MNKNSIDVLWNRKSTIEYGIRNIKRTFNRYSFTSGHEVVRTLPNGKRRILFKGSYKECISWVVRNRIPVSIVWIEMLSFCLR